MFVLIQCCVGVMFVLYLGYMLIQCFVSVMSVLYLGYVLIQCCVLIIYEAITLFINYITTTINI